MDKWDYIDLISKIDHRYGYLLLEMMERYHRNNLQEITEQEAKDFYIALGNKGE